MANQDFTVSFQFDQTPETVFDAINDVRGWWSEEFAGSSEHLEDEFDVRFADVHYSRQRLMEVIPGKKIVWLVTDSDLSFLENRSEWTGTRISFEIVSRDSQSELIFTHWGLVPASECYKDCYNGWNHFLRLSLVPLITTGKGQPNILNEEVALKSQKN